MKERKKERKMVGILLAVLLAALSYWILVSLAGAPVWVGAIAAVLILVVGILGSRSLTGRRT